MYCPAQGCGPQPGSLLCYAAVDLDSATGVPPRPRFSAASLLPFLVMEARVLSCFCIGCRGFLSGRLFETRLLTEAVSSLVLSTSFN